MLVGPNRHVDEALGPARADRRDSWSLVRLLGKGQLSLPTGRTAV